MVAAGTAIGSPGVPVAARHRVRVTSATALLWRWGINGWPLLMHPAALGDPPNLIGLAEPRTVALIVVRAREAAVAVA